MARPKKFEREDALLKAKMVFWSKGFSATTTDDLRLAMGIGRQSFYDTFKSKHELFIEVLSRYNSERVQRLAELVGNCRSFLDALVKVLADIANEEPKRRALGCIGVASVCEFGTSDPDVQGANNRAGDAWRGILQKLIVEGQHAGEIRTSADKDTAASYLLTVSMGMRVAARGGMKPKELREIAALAVDGLKA